MTTDIFGTSNFKKNEKEILELVSKEICVQISEERKQKVDSIVIHVDVNRRYIHYDSELPSMLDSSIECFKVDIMSGQHIETIDGDAAETIYKKYLELVGKYTMQSIKPFVCHSLL